MNSYCKKSGQSPYTKNPKPHQSLPAASLLYGTPYPVNNKQLLFLFSTPRTRDDDIHLECRGNSNTFDPAHEQLPRRYVFPRYYVGSAKSRSLPNPFSIPKRIGISE